MMMQIEFIEKPVTLQVKEETGKMHKTISNISRNLHGENAKLKTRIATLEEKLNFLEHMICNPHKPYMEIR